MPFKATKQILFWDRSWKHWRDQMPNNLLPKSMNKYFTYIFESSVIIIELEMTIIKSMIDISNQNSEV